MMVTNEQLASAIRVIGGAGEPFSSATLRAHLGIVTEDRRAITRFNEALRAYCRVNTASLVRVGKHRYRSLDIEPEPDQQHVPLRRIVIRITRGPAEEEIEPQPFSLWTLFASLGQSMLRVVGFGRS